MVIWIIGKSGSGKTFFTKKLKKKILNDKLIHVDGVIHVDGDEIRKYFFDNQLGFSIKDRKNNSLFIIKLCNFLEKKGYLVLCSIQSIFPEHQKLNRKKFKKYYQVYIKADLTKLKKRNNKKVYSNRKNVVGKDIKFPEPHKSNYIFENNFKDSYKLHIKNIIKNLSKI